MAVQTLFYTKLFLYLISTGLLVAWLSMLAGALGDNLFFFRGLTAAVSCSALAALWSCAMSVVYIASNSSSRVWLLTPPLFVIEVVAAALFFYVFHAVQVYTNAINLNVPAAQQSKELAALVIGWVESVVLIAIVALVAASRNVDYYVDTEEGFVPGDKNKQRLSNRTFLPASNDGDNHQTGNNTAEIPSATTEPSATRILLNVQDHEAPGISGPVRGQEHLVYDINPVQGRSMAVERDRTSTLHGTGPPVIQYQAPPVMGKTSGSIDGTSSILGQSPRESSIR